MWHILPIIQRKVSKLLLSRFSKFLKLQLSHRLGSPPRVSLWYQVHRQTSQSPFLFQCSTHRRSYLVYLTDLRAWIMILLMWHSHGQVRSGQGKCQSSVVFLCVCLSHLTNKISISNAVWKCGSWPQVSRCFDNLSNMVRQWTKKAHRS